MEGKVGGADLPISRMDFTPAETSATGHFVNSGRSAEISRASEEMFSLRVKKRKRTTYYLGLHGERLPC